MTCKDCIHDGVCHLQEMSTGLEIEEYIKEFGCEDFKNKADFVELPCKTVYYIMDKHSLCPIVMSKPIEYLRVYEVMNLEYYGYYKTQEEAEKKLEEMKNG